MSKDAMKDHRLQQVLVQWDIYCLTFDFGNGLLSPPEDSYTKNPTKNILKKDMHVSSVEFYTKSDHFGSYVTVKMLYEDGKQGEDKEIRSENSAEGEDYDEEYGNESSYELWEESEAEESEGDYDPKDQEKDNC